MLNYNELIQKITTLSPTASDTIDNESYKIKIINGDVTDSQILKEVFLCLNQDMNELGIYFIVNIDEILSNGYDLTNTIEILNYIMPNTLYMKLKSNSILVDILSDLINNPVDDDNVLINYITTLGGADGNQAYDDTLNEGSLFLLDKITSTDQFCIYISNLLKLLPTNETNELSQTQIEEYNEYTIQFVKYLYDAMFMLNNNYKFDSCEDIYTKLNKRLKVTQSILTKPSSMNSLYFIFLSDKTTPLEKDIFKDKKTEFFSGFKLSPTYFAIRKIEVTILDILGFCCFTYTLSKLQNSDLLESRLSKLCQMYPKSKTQINTITKILLSGEF